MASKFYKILFAAKPSTKLKKEGLISFSPFSIELLVEAVIQ
jgi:hypothetical protein